MATDSSNIRKVFSFPKAIANPLFAVTPAAATTAALQVSNDAPAPFIVPFTRDKVQKTRLEDPDLQATTSGQIPQGSIETKASLDTRQDFSGLEAFSRPRESTFLHQTLQSGVAAPVFSLATARPKNASSDVSNLILATSHRDYMTTSLPDLISDAKTHQPLHPPANFPANGTGWPQPLLHQRKSLRPQNKATAARSSTPAHAVSETDSAPVDYAVFQSLMTAQSKKERLLKEKEGLLNEARKEMGLLQKQNDELAAELDRTKEKTRKYIQQCDKLVRSAQNEAQNYHASSREAYARCIEEVQANIPDLQSLRSELTERMGHIEFQLDEEHQHRAKIGPEILHELETLKHRADFLRDKVADTTADLLAAKLRVSELEEASLKENVALTHALNLLDDTRQDLATARQELVHNTQAHSEELEAHLEGSARATATQIEDLQRTNKTLTEVVRQKEDEITKLKADLEAHSLKIDGLKVLQDDLKQVKDLLVERDHQLAIVQTQQQADKKRAEELAAQIKSDVDVRARLEDALCVSAGLKAQHEEHLANCTERKGRVELLKGELSTAQKQASQAQRDLKQALSTHEIMENGFEDLKATSRVKMQDLIDTRNKLDKAQEYTEKQQNIAKEQLEKAAEERKRLENLLEQNVQTLKRTQEDLAEAKAETKRLELAAVNDVERVQLRTQLAEHQKLTSNEKNQLQASIFSLEKELRGSLAAQKVSTDETAQKMNRLANENGKIIQQLEISLAKYQELLDSLGKIRAANDGEIKAHSLEKTRLQVLLQESDRNLALSKEQLGEALQVQFLTNQANEHTRSLERTAENKLASERWLKTDDKINYLTSMLLDVVSSIQTVVDLASAIAAAQDATLNVPSLDLLNSQVGGLQEQLKAATDHSMALEYASRTLLERHQRSELTEQESALVKLVASSTMQVNEKERIQGLNDLRRRDANIQALQKRIKELEKQLASRIESKSPTGQLMTMTDILHSSPLSIVEEIGALQQRVVGISMTPAEQSALNRSFPIGHASAARAGIHGPIALNHDMTFAKLNQASSEDAEDDDDAIRQFSDKKMDDVLSMQDRLPPARTMKRGRDEDSLVPVGPIGGKSVGTRATRRRKLSNGSVVVASEGVAGIRHAHGFKKLGGTTGEGKNVGGTGEGGGTTAVAKYKAAQRGKLGR